MPVDIKKLQDYGKKLRAADMPEPEIRRAVDQYERELESEAQAERAPEGLTAQQVAGLNLERASQGLDPLLPSDDNRTLPDQKRALSSQQIAQINLARAHDGLRPLTAEEIAHEQVKRAVYPGAIEGERAPKGLHPTRLAQENLKRACRGEPALLPYEDNEDAEE